MAKLNGVKTLDMVNGEITKVAYEGAEYVKVGGSAEEGDLLLSNEDLTDSNAGDYFLVLSEEKFLDNAGDLRSSDAGFDYTFFRKISAQSKPTLEQRVGALESDAAALKGEKVAGEPKRLTVGDIAKIIGKESGHFGEIGDIVMIIEDAKDAHPYRCELVSDGIDVGWFYEEELVAYNEETIEFEVATYRKVDREAREGDVVIFRGSTRSWVINGVPYAVKSGAEIIDNDGDKVYVYNKVVGRTRETVDVYELIEQTEKVVSKPRLKAGDFVKITRKYSHYDNSKTYEIVEKERHLGIIDEDDDFNTNAIRDGKYEIVDAETSKWAKIGRKPNEFKQGDVVRVLGTCNGHEIAGQLGEVVKPDGTDRPLVRAVYSDELVLLYSRIELVAPVESLFNNA